MNWIYVVTIKDAFAIGVLALFVLIILYIKISNWFTRKKK